MLQSREAREQPARRTAGEGAAGWQPSTALGLPLLLPRRPLESSSLASWTPSVLFFIVCIINRWMSMLIFFIAVSCAFQLCKCSDRAAPRHSEPVPG